MEYYEMKIVTVEQFGHAWEAQNGKEVLSY